MKVVSLDDVVGTLREVHCPKGGFISARLLVKSDGMGFSVHHTFIPAGEPQHWHYTQHLEACYCVSGRGILTTLKTGQKHMIRMGTIYALDEHDDHTFQALEDTVLISIFNPPVVGTEVHQEDGSYAAVEGDEVIDKREAVLNSMEAMEALWRKLA